MAEHVINLAQPVIEGAGFVYDTEALLLDGTTEKPVPVCHQLMQRLFGCSADAFYEQLTSSDKASKKAAKAKAKAINARFNGLSGRFELGVGPHGLTVFGVPDRRPPTAEGVGSPL